MGASVVLTQPEDDDAAMERVQPLTPGTTWVYEVTDHEEPSGTRVRQVLGPAQLIHDGELVEMARISSDYDSYPGQGRQRTEAYVGVNGDELLQYGLVARGDTLDVSPAAPVYRLPAEPGTAWTYDGLLGSNPLVFKTEVTDVGDVEVGGHTFTDCTEWTSIVQVADAPEGAVETLTDWTCPGIGTVRSIDSYPAGGVLITEELREFHSPEMSWSASTTNDADTESRPESAATAAGFDEQRSHAVDGRLARRLTWSDSRDLVSAFARVAHGQTEVLAEQDGAVTARDLTTGELRWQVMLAPPIVANPAISPGLVLVADGEKNLWALRLEDGSAQWVRRFDDVVSETPAVSEDAVAVAVEDGSVNVLSLEDGATEWSAELAGRARNAPALAEDILVVGDDSGALSAFELADGDVVWTAGLENGLDHGPTIGDDHVLAVDGDGVLASYDLANGDLQWQARGKGFPSEALTATDDEVVTVGDGVRVEAFDLEEGHLNWSRRLGELDTAVAVVGEEVMAVETSGRVHVLARDDGARVDSWRLPSPAPGVALEVDLPLALVGDAVVVTAEVDAVNYAWTSYAYQVREDAPRGVSFAGRHHEFPVPVNVPAVLDGGDLYAAGIDGTIYRGRTQRPAEPVVTDLGTVFGFDVEDGVLSVPRGDQVWGVPARGGDPLWKFPAVEAFFGSIPVLAHGTAFLPLRETGLVAVDARSGEPRWAAPLTGSTGTSSPVPLAGGDIAYAAAGLMRLDGRSGEIEWRLGGPLRDAVAYSGITAHGGGVYAVLTGPDPEAPSLERTRIVAADAESGDVRWQHELAGAPLAIAPGAGAEAVVVIDAANVVSAFDPVSGKQLWTFQLDTIPSGGPLLHDGVVLLVESGLPEDLVQRRSRVVALDARSGAYLGSFEPPGMNDSFLPNVGRGEDGQLLLPTVDAVGQTVMELEADRG